MDSGDIEYSGDGEGSENIEGSEDTEDLEDSEIATTLISINHVTLQIQRELNTLDQLITNNGTLRTAVTKTNDLLMRIARDLNLNVIDIIEQKRNDSEGSTVSATNLFHELLTFNDESSPSP